MKKVLFIKNAMVLTVTALILRLIGIVFRVWLADSIGAEGMGLYQVICSVYVLASTFATSGISTAVTRMVTERLAVGDKNGARRVLHISVSLSLLIAAVTSAVIIFFAEPIAIYLIQDIRAVPSLKILCLGLPFMGACSCIRGYFLARRSTVPPSLGQIAEQLVRMAVIVFLINRYAHLGITATSAAVLAGDSVAEGAGTLLIWLLYKFDVKKLVQRSLKPLKKRLALKELLRISVPISSGRYLHTALRTAENLLTPSCLSKYSASKTTALEQFGMIKGMALPLLLFPASLLSSVSTLLVPEMTQSAAENDNRAIEAAVEKVFYITAVVSFLIAGIFFTAAYQLGEVVYSSGSVGYLIRALAPLIPFMYIDLIADGILKGLDQQKFLFKSNVTDSAVRILLVLMLVPRFGMMGFLGVMFFSNLFTSVLSVIRIVKITKISFNFKIYFWCPLLAAFASSAISDYLCRNLRESHILYLIAVSVGVFVLYFVFLALFGGINLRRIISKIGGICSKYKRTV